MARGGLGSGSWNFMHRGRPSVGCDLKHRRGRELALRLCERGRRARRGVPARGHGAARARSRRRRARATATRLRADDRLRPGGADGGGRRPRHQLHLAVGGARRDRPGRGAAAASRSTSSATSAAAAMLLALGVLAAVIEARESGQRPGRRRVDGRGRLGDDDPDPRDAGDRHVDASRPGTNLLDSGAHFYEVYECSDGGHIAVGALEPQFYAELLELIGARRRTSSRRWSRRVGRSSRSASPRSFATRTRDEWAAILEPAEACATPVLGLGEAPRHPHNAARGSFVEVGGKLQPAPAPRFSRTPGGVPDAARRAGRRHRAGAFRVGPRGRRDRPPRRR